MINDLMKYLVKQWWWQQWRRQQWPRKLIRSWRSKAKAVENGRVEAWGAGVERRGVETAGTVKLGAEDLKEVLEMQRRNRGVQEVVKTKK